MTDEERKKLCEELREIGRYNSEGDLRFKAANEIERLAARIEDLERLGWNCAELPQSDAEPQNSDGVTRKDVEGWMRYFDEHAEEFVAAHEAIIRKAHDAEPVASDPLDPTREYIPLPAQWEIQTKGKGSSYRLLDRKTGERMMIMCSDSHREHDFVTRMAKEIHAATAPPRPDYELSAISAAIGSSRFMDPPDGGDVSLAEQVSRMREALERAEAARPDASEIEQLKAELHNTWQRLETALTSEKGWKKRCQFVEAERDEARASRARAADRSGK